MSSFSGHEEDDYETDCTTPAHSCSGEHIENEEVESFRAREYPQLDGKVYLDHGGSTVSLPHPTSPSCRLTNPSCMPSQW
jgi:molybdenum cofactor sulfurtransferase